MNGILFDPINKGENEGASTRDVVICVDGTCLSSCVSLTADTGSGCTTCSGGFPCSGSCFAACVDVCNNGCSSGTCSAACANFCTQYAII